jgi:glycine/D-amino acid oxidase-like deaminating enzyme
MAHLGRRIGIIGGGASGLAMAHALRERGFSRVTVLEQGAEPGGKCCTFWHGGRSYELGAAIITPAYRHTWALARKYGLAPKLCLGVAFIDADSGRVLASPYVPPGLGVLGAMRLPAQVGRLLWSDLSRRKREFPRLDTADASLAEPFESWCSKRGMRDVLEALRPWATSFGYGYMDEVPAAYMLNYMCLAGATYELHEDGYRGLWLRVARDLDVRCNARVTRVERRSTIEVSTATGRFEFDDVVLACPLEAVLEFLDTSAEERGLFSQVRYVDYQVVAAEVSGLPKWRYVFVPRNFGREAADKPMFYYRRYPDRDLVTFYSSRGPRGLAGAEREVERLVQRMGGRVRSILTTHLWRYFPHVSSESMRSGFYQRFEALQGVRSTYYASEVLSFSCVEPVVAYAVNLVHRHFGGGTAALENRATASRSLPRHSWRVLT